MDLLLLSPDLSHSTRLVMITSLVPTPDSSVKCGCVVSEPRVCCCVRCEGGVRGVRCAVRGVRCGARDKRQLQETL